MPRPYTATPPARAALAALARSCARIRTAAAEAEARRLTAAMWHAAARDLRRHGIAAYAHHPAA